MPIKTLTDVSIVRVCSICKAESAVQHADIALGAEDGQDPSVDKVIKLPPCSGCGAPEFLIRTEGAFSDMPNGDPKKQQRGAINRLWKQLVDAGKAGASTAARLAASPLPDLQVLAPVPTADVSTHSNLPSVFPDQTPPAPLSGEALQAAIAAFMAARTNQPPG